MPRISGHFYFRNICMAIAQLARCFICGQIRLMANLVGPLLGHATEPVNRHK